MPRGLLKAASGAVTPLIPIEKHRFGTWLESQDTVTQRWVQGTGWQAKPNSWCWLPGDDGQPRAVAWGIDNLGLWSLGDAPTRLPPGDYRLEGDLDVATRQRLSIGWGLGSYQFDRYCNGKPVATLVLDTDVDQDEIDNWVEAVSLVRDLVNTPADAMMPEQLYQASEALATRFGGEVRQIVGEQLLVENYPSIHAVGRASVHEPRLIDLRWGNPDHPRLTLVGKGVCFDSGGLDLKPASGMRLMKKDMGGSAHVLGLARAIMGRGLPVRLRVLIAAVENAVSGNAFRPGDVLATRKGITVEIENTDAEGRLVLSDALTEAASEEPVLIMDFATLTGAARVALGPDIPALFSNNDDLAQALMSHGEAEDDPLWRLPLYAPYREMLKSRIATIANSSPRPFGGAITAGLFLQEFVPASTPWAHLDILAWNLQNRPGRPEGGEAVGLRGVYRYLITRFGN